MDFLLGSEKIHQMLHHPTFQGKITPAAVWQQAPQFPINPWFELLLPIKTGVHHEKLYRYIVHVVVLLTIWPNPSGLVHPRFVLSPKEWPHLNVFWESAALKTPVFSFAEVPQIRSLWYGRCRITSLFRDPYVSEIQTTPVSDQ